MPEQSPEFANVFADVAAAAAELDQLVSPLDDDQWQLPTPAPGWTIAHQVAHLSANFHLVAAAATDPDEYQARTASFGGDFDANQAALLAPYLAQPARALLDRWRVEFAAAERALAQVPDGQLVPWLRSLPAPVLAAAGVMELFAHGQDIADALRRPRRYPDWVRPLVGFAVRNWDFGYRARGLPVPEIELRYELTAPSGAAWEHGPAGATERIAGPAVDFCLLVTRRRHRADLALVATGAEADRWLDLAQAYRGGPGADRAPGQFAYR